MVKIVILNFKMEHECYRNITQSERLSLLGV